MKYLKFMLLFALLFALSACQSMGTNTASYEIYYRSADRSFGQAALCPQTRTVPEGQPPVEVLLGYLLEGPEGEGLVRAIPSGVTLHSWTLHDGVLTVDFSGQYATLSGVDLSLADYSVALTLGQLEGVSSVVTTVEGDRITYRDHQNLMVSDVLLAIYRSEPVQREVRLYFPQANGSGLLEEARILSLGEDDGLTMAVLLALADGPQGGDGLAVLPNGAVLSAEVRSEICYLNLAGSFSAMASGNEAHDRLVIEALVETLCSLDTISAVRFLSEGEPMLRYGTMDVSEHLTGKEAASEAAFLADSNIGN